MLSIIVVGVLITVVMLALLNLDSKLLQKKIESSPIPSTTPQPQEDIFLEASGSGDIDNEQGVVTTDWEVLVELIEACEATSITQSHSKEVRITTKEGFILRAKEPEIDDIFTVYNNIKETCGSIPIATE